MLSLTILPGHPTDLNLGSYSPQWDGRIRVNTPSGRDFRDGGNGYSDYNDGFELMFDLRGYTSVDDYTFAISGSSFPPGQLGDPYLGEYTMVLSNSLALEGEQKLSQSMMERTEIIQSPVNNFSIFATPGNIGYANSLLSGSWYTDQYGACLLYTSPSPRDQRGSRMPSSA